MKARLTSSVRRPVRWALLPAIAIIGVLAGSSAAFAVDQQATDDALSTESNWQAARGTSHAGAYAQSNEGTVYAPRHRSYR